MARWTRDVAERSSAPISGSLLGAATLDVADLWIRLERVASGDDDKELEAAAARATASPSDVDRRLASRVRSGDENGCGS
jgi:hypothetical protein